jgi:hypothetical protein
MSRSVASTLYTHGKHRQIARPLLIIKKYGHRESGRPKKTRQETK